MTKIEIVLGSLFGDEGKGNAVQFLCLEELKKGIMPLVIRFSGGSQCGHRVVYNGMEHECSLLGSGVLLGCATYHHKGVMIDPIALKLEWEMLNQKYGIEPAVFIHPDCRVIIPDDLQNNQKNQETIRHGTCGCGIFECFKRYERKPMKGSITQILSTVDEFIDKVKMKYDVEEFKSACEWMKEHIYVRELGEIQRIFSTGIFEGSQGLLLDMDNGFMPNCTPSRVGLNGIPKEYLSNAEVYLVLRSYLTRHGNGYEPHSEKLIRKLYKNLEEPTNPDDGMQGKFKIGVLDVQLLRDAFVRHHLDNYERLYNVRYNIIMTHMDCASHMAPDSIMAKSGCVTKEVTVKHFLELASRNIIKINNIYMGYGPESNIIRR